MHLHLHLRLRLHFHFYLHLHLHLHWHLHAYIHIHIIYNTVYCVIWYHGYHGGKPTLWCLELSGNVAYSIKCDAHAMPMDHFLGNPGNPCVCHTSHTFFVGRLPQKLGSELATGRDPPERMVSWLKNNMETQLGHSENLQSLPMSYHFGYAKAYAMLTRVEVFLTRSKLRKSLRSPYAALRKWGFCLREMRYDKALTENVKGCF